MTCSAISSSRAKMPHLPYVIEKWRTDHPEQEYEDGQVWVAKEPVGTGKKNRADHVTYYQFKRGRAARTLRGIDAQVAKAQVQVDGHAAVKRNRFIKLDGARKSINRDLEAKARSLAGLKAYLTNVKDPTPDAVIGATSGSTRSRRHSAWRSPTSPSAPSTTGCASRSRRT